MSRFADHFKAEIFSEAFAKVFFSGPKGRLAAFVFMAAYAVMKMSVVAIFSVFAGICWIVSKILGRAFGHSYFSNRRVFRTLKKHARAFGDVYEKTDGGEWIVHAVSGTGFRSGRFELELRSHSNSGAVRAILSNDGERVEFDNGTVSAVAGRSGTFANSEDFPSFYKNLRTHFL